MNLRSKPAFQILAITLVALAAGAMARDSGLLNLAIGQKSEKAKKKESKMQCPMMAAIKGLELYADGAPVLLAKQDELQLTKKQVAELEKLQKAYRTRARQVLTESQRKEVGPAPKARVSIMELAMSRKSKGKTSSKKMCPMCAKMMKMMRGKKNSGEDSKSN